MNLTAFLWLSFDLALLHFLKRRIVRLARGLDRSSLHFIGVAKHLLYPWACPLRSLTFLESQSVCLVLRPFDVAEFVTALFRQ